MWVEGKIKSYITERGFGFISIGGAAKDLFFHVRDLPNKDVEPKLGEQLKFQIVEDNGKLKADQIVRLDLKPEGANLSHSFKQMHSRRNASPRFNKRSATGLIFTVLGCIVIVFLSILVYQKYQQHREFQKIKTEQLILQQAQIVEQQRKALGQLPERILSKSTEQHLNAAATSSRIAAPVMTVNTQPQAAVSSFKCDGRQHCSQMGSYEEAVFFLRNCPSTKMDGDNDGIPCEDQFGRH